MSVMQAPTQDPRGRVPATIAVVVTAALWGTTGLAASFAAPLSAITTGAAGMGIGGLVLGLFGWCSVVAALRMLGARPTVLLGALSLCVFTLCFYASMGMAGIAIGTIVTICSSPIFAALLQRSIDHTPLTPRWYVAALLSIGGGGLLVAGKESGGGWMGSDPAQLPWGVLVGLCAGVAYALYAWLLRRLIQPAPLRPHGLPRNMAVSAIQATAAIPLLLFVGVTGGGQLADPGVRPALLYLGLVPMALGHALFARSLVALSAATATLYTLLEPVVATILAVLVVGERLRVTGWVGLVAVLCGLVILTLPKNYTGKHD